MVNQYFQFYKAINQSNCKSLTSFRLFVCGIIFYSNHALYHTVPLKKANLTYCPTFN